MKRKKWMVICMALGLGVLPGCGEKGAGEKQEEARPQEIVPDSVGKGFRPPEGSHIDKKGNIVDKEGNTFNRKGEWQVPEGGHVNEKGQIVDKNGKVMGGGAKVGSVG